MRTLGAVIVLSTFVLLTPLAHAVEFPQKWVYASSNFTTADGAKQAGEQLQRFKKVGATHLLLIDSKMARLYSATPDYFQRVTDYLAEAKKLNITIVPSIYQIGYSGSWFHFDSNLASGIPVKDAPFLVTTGVARPDPDSAPTLANPDFEQSAGPLPTGWKLSRDVSGIVSLDTNVKHAGNASAKFANLDKLPKEKPAEPQTTNSALYLTQTLKVKPWQYYRLSLFAKTKDLKASEQFHVYITSRDGLRRHAWTNLGIKENQDWTQHFITFNTLEADQITVGLGVNGATSGTLWYDDLKLEPAGFLLILRRDLLPLKVTSEDGKTVYEEGKDFKPVRDPAIAKEPFPGDFPIDHDPVPLVLTYHSRIQEGQKLLVSYYHPMRIFSDQDVISLQDPEVFRIMEDQARRAVKAWPTGHYMLNYDEIRVGGFEPQPQGENLTPGQLLARHFKQGYDILKKHAPQATAYTWSDMFTPYHNARPFDQSTHEGKGFYYMTPGTFEGSWEGVPKDVVIMQWWSPDPKNVKFFADRGHPQVLCGFYDATQTLQMQRNIATWMTVSKDLPNILGFMYTTWHANYKQLEEYFQLLDQYPAWLKDLPAEKMEQ